MNGTVVLDVFAPIHLDAGLATASLVTATPVLAHLFPRMIGADEGAPRAIATHRRRAGEVSVGSVSELCQVVPETPVKHRDLQGHSDAHHCCGTSLMRSALLSATGINSKRAPSTTRTSLRLESTVCERSSIRVSQDALYDYCSRTLACIQRFTDGSERMVEEIVSDLLTSYGMTLCQVPGSRTSSARCRRANAWRQ
jgi:hypothetical protein